jgi:hypothetical protein
MQSGTQASYHVTYRAGCPTSFLGGDCVEGEGDSRAVLCYRQPISTYTVALHRPVAYQRKSSAVRYVGPEQKRPAMGWARSLVQSGPVRFYSVCWNAVTWPRPSRSGVRVDLRLSRGILPALHLTYAVRSCGYPWR